MIESTKDPNNDIITPQKMDEDIQIEQSLRPSHFDEFVGQSETIENLKIYIEAATQRGESLDHVLLFGPPGLGKTTLANIIASEMSANINFSTINELLNVKININFLKGKKSVEERDFSSALKYFFYYHFVIIN